MAPVCAECIWLLSLNAVCTYACTHVVPVFFLFYIPSVFPLCLVSLLCMCCVHSLTHSFPDPLTHSLIHLIPYLIPQSTRDETIRAIRQLPPSFPEFMSPGLVDYITSALVKPADQRSSLSDLMRHPWILGHARWGWDLVGWLVGMVVRTSKWVGG